MRLHLSCICFLFRSAVCSPGGGGAGTNREGSELQEDYRPVVPRADSKATPQSLEDVTDDAVGSAVSYGLAEPGQRILILAGTPFGAPGAANLLRLAHAPAKAKR